MENIKRAQLRMRNYPGHLIKCSVPAKAYASCVTRDFNVTQNACAKEFHEFKKCLREVAKNVH